MPRSAKSKPEPQPVVMELKPSEYDRIAQRVIAAVDELNLALKDANACQKMRVYLGSKGTGTDGDPAQFAYGIYRMTHSVVSFSVTAQEPQWTRAKDAAFQKATTGAGKRETA